MHSEQHVPCSWYCICSGHCSLPPVSSWHHWAIYCCERVGPLLPLATTATADVCSWVLGHAQWVANGLSETGHPGLDICSNGNTAHAQYTDNNHIYIYSPVASCTSSYVHHLHRLQFPCIVVEVCSGPLTLWAVCLEKQGPCWGDNLEAEVPIQTGVGVFLVCMVVSSGAVNAHVTHGRWLHLRHLHSNHTLTFTVQRLRFKTIGCLRLPEGWGEERETGIHTAHQDTRQCTHKWQYCYLLSEPHGNKSIQNHKQLETSDMYGLTLIWAEVIQTTLHTYIWTIYVLCDILQESTCNSWPSRISTCTMPFEQQKWIVCWR